MLCKWIPQKAEEGVLHWENSEHGGKVAPGTSSTEKGLGYIRGAQVAGLARSSSFLPVPLGPLPTHPAGVPYCQLHRRLTSF